MRGPKRHCAVGFSRLLGSRLRVYSTPVTFTIELEREADGRWLAEVPTLPGVLSSVYPIASQPWMYPIPILGQHLLASDVLGGKSPAPVMFVAAAATALATAALLVRLTTRLLQRERIVFGR